MTNWPNPNGVAGGITGSTAKNVSVDTEHMQTASLLPASAQPLSRLNYPGQLHGSSAAWLALSAQELWDSSRLRALEELQHRLLCPAQ